MPNGCPPDKYVSSIALLYDSQILFNFASRVTVGRSALLSVFNGGDFYVLLLGLISINKILVYKERTLL